MKAIFFVFTLLLILPRATFADVPVLDVPLTISDGAGGSQELRFGFDPSATDGYDGAFGEAVLPPVGFPGTFDARFIGTDIGIPLTDGSWKDYRQGTIPAGQTRIHELQYQVGSGTAITISWNLPNGVSGRLQDIITGTLINKTMSGSGDTTLMNPSGFPRLKMTMTYQPGLPVQLSRFAARVLAPSSVLLEWTTLSETNNYGFEVQRRASGDAEYQTIPNSFIPGHGTTLQPQQYSFTDVTVTSGQWSYRLKQIDLDGAVHYSGAVSIGILTYMNQRAMPNVFALHQNYPNPFNPSTRIHYDLPRASRVSLKVFSPLGQEIAALVDEAQEPGYKSVEFQTSGVASGVYLLRLHADTFVETRKMIVVK